MLERTAPLLVVLCFADDSTKKKRSKGKKGKKATEAEPRVAPLVVKSSVVVPRFTDGAEDVSETRPDGRGRPGGACLWKVFYRRTIHE